MSFISNIKSWFKGGITSTPPLNHSSSYHNAMMGKIQREKTLQEEFAYTPPYELINPWAPFFDGLKLLFPLFPARFDYRYAQNYIFLSQTQLDLFRVYGRWLYETNPWAQGALGALADYSIHTGFQYSVSAKKHEKASKSLLKQCNKFLEDFLNRNQWWIYERELFIRKKRDGDAFLRFFPQDDGVTQVRVVEPEQIRNVTEDSPEWSFGILTDIDDHVNLLAFHVWYSSNSKEGETVPASEMMMFKNHTDRNVKRGLGDFFNVQDLLEDSAKLLRAGRQGEAVRQAISYVREWSQANASAVLALQATNTDFQIPVYNNLQSPATKLENNTQVFPGEVHDVPEGMLYKEPPIGKSENCQIMLDTTLRAAAAKWRVPSWLLTADAGHVNFAAALVAESPLVKRIEVDQHTHKMDYLAVMNRILEIGALQGILPQDVTDRVEVMAECPSVAARHPEKETEICSTLASAGLISRRSWSSREGLDYDTEQDLIAQEGGPITVGGDQEGGAGSGTASSDSPSADYKRATDDRN